MANGPNVEKRGVWRGVDEKVEVAVIRIAAMEHRAEHAGITPAMGFHHGPDAGTVGVKTLNTFSDSFPLWGKAGMGAATA